MPSTAGRVSETACLFAYQHQGVRCRKAQEMLLTLLVLEQGREQWNCRMTSRYENVLHDFAEYNRSSSMLLCKNSLYDKINCMNLFWILQDVN